MSLDIGVAPKKEKRPKKLLEPAPSQENAQDNKLVRALGSVDWHTRESGLLAITALLNQSHDISEDQLMKIWKGIHFAFWHSDKTPVQMELAERLAKIGNQIDPQLGLKYLKTFLLTMRREWGTIDHHRLDKYLSLVRKFMRELCTFLARADWEAQVVKEVGDFLLGEIMVPQSGRPALGLTLHVSQVAAEEMCVAWEGNPPPSSAWPAILDPYCLSVASTTHEGVLHRLCDEIFGTLMRARTEALGGGQTAVVNLDAAGLGKILFETGAQPKVRAANRKELYSLSTQFEALARRLRKRSADGPLQPLANGGQDQAGGPGSGGTADRAGHNPSHADASPSMGSENASDNTLKVMSSSPRREKKDRKRRQQELTTLADDFSGEAPLATSPPAGSPSSGQAASPAKEKKPHKRLKTMQLSPAAGPQVSQSGPASQAGEKAKGVAELGAAVLAIGVANALKDSDGSGLRVGSTGENGAHAGPEGSGLSGKKLRKKLRLQLQQQEQKDCGEKSVVGDETRVMSPAPKAVVTGDAGAAEGVESPPWSSPKEQKKLQRQLFLAGGKDSDEGDTGQAVDSTLKPKKLLVKLRGRKESATPNGLAVSLLGNSLGSPLSPDAGAKTAPPVIRQGRKHVRWSLDQNLYHEKGAPVPPAEIRTPPTAKPKGSALKQQAMCRTSLTFRSPGSVPRARAGSFF